MILVEDVWWALFCWKIPVEFHFDMEQSATLWNDTKLCTSDKQWQDIRENRMPLDPPLWAGLCQFIPIHSCQTCAEMCFILSLQLVHSFLSSLLTVDLNPQKKTRKGKWNLTVTPRNETFQVPCFKIVWGMPHSNLPSFTNSLSVQHVPFSQGYLSVWWFPSPAHDLQPDVRGLGSCSTVWWRFIEFTEDSHIGIDLCGMGI